MTKGKLSCCDISLLVNGGTWETCSLCSSPEWFIVVIFLLLWRHNQGLSSGRLGGDRGGAQPFVQQESIHMLLPEAQQRQQLAVSWSGPTSPEVDLPPQLCGDPRSSGTASKYTWDVPLEEIAPTRLLSCLYSVHLDFLSLLPFSLSHLAYMLALFLFLWFCLFLKLYSFNSFYWSLYLTPYCFNQPVWLCLNNFFIVKFLFFSIVDTGETKLRKCLQSFSWTHLLCKNHSDKSSLPSYELSRLGHYLNLLLIICKMERKKKKVFFPKLYEFMGM